MNAKRLAGRPAIGTAAIFTLCVLVLSVSASIKNPVTRPWRTHGVFTATITQLQEPWVDEDTGLLVVGTWTLTGNAVATHAGRYADEGEGVVCVDMETGAMYGIGSGCATSASGDQVTWDSFEPLDESCRVTVTFTGGTGRFEKATGQFTFVYPEPAGSEGWTAELIGVGTITY
ncbi:MAG: hypothetical protein AB9869_09035 [Verrucomicrobiia bacterium]